MGGAVRAYPFPEDWLTSHVELAGAVGACEHVRGLFASFGAPAASGGKQPSSRGPAEWRMDTLDHGFVANYQFLAKYNRWFNRRLFDACEQLPDAERRRDRGAFFSSIAASLNHLLWVDHLWLGRFAAQAFLSLHWLPSCCSCPTAPFMRPSFMRIGQRCVRREKHSIRPSKLGCGTCLAISLRERCDSVLREHPARQALSHFFNHQTHHRGQVTTLLCQAGVGGPLLMLDHGSPCL